MVDDDNMSGLSEKAKTKTKATTKGKDIHKDKDKTAKD
jgi:hypothetical protein